MSFNLISMVILMLVSVIGVGQPVSFQKIRSGTRADIRFIMTDRQQGVYFITDKIHVLEKDIWVKRVVPVDGKIYFFNGLSADDFWFNVNHVTNTCLLYHCHDGITENISPGLANSITAMYFISDGKALFAGYADIAAYDQGKFRILPPSPARSSILRIFAQDLSSFYILTGEGEMYRYSQGSYQEVMAGDSVTDFCFAGRNDGYLISGAGLYRVSEKGTKMICSDPDLLKISKMTLSPDGMLWMVGAKGLIMSFQDGSLIRHIPHCAENLNDIAVTGSGEIWVCGDRGLLLYAGDKKFPSYVQNNQGFSSYKLIFYGINTDDEYGVALADFNGDDKTDIYAVRIYEQNRLYINNFSPFQKLNSSHGFFEEVVKRSATGIVDPENSKVENELKLGIGAADIDNDGDQDVYLCYLNSNNKLLLNRGNGYFRNVSAQEHRACGNFNRSNAASFSDVDNDGDLDLFVTSEEASNRLFENDGTGHFKDITVASGLGSTGGGMCASFADVNNDGYADLCVSFWYPSNKLFINESMNGAIRFRDATALTGLAKAVPSKSNGVAFADVNNDGSPDLFIANRNTGNKLYINDGTGIFTDATTDFFHPERTMSNGAVFADFDLDGYQDLYVSNVGDNVLYKNMNGIYFQDVTADFGAELSGYCTGCAAGDVDNDGDPDLYVANYINGNSNLFLNITEKKSFIKFKLHGIRSHSPFPADINRFYFRRFHFCQPVFHFQMAFAFFFHSAGHPAGTLVY